MADYRTIKKALANLEEATREFNRAVEGTKIPAVDLNRVRKEVYKANPYNGMSTGWQIFGAVLESYADYQDAKKEEEAKASAVYSTENELETIKSQKFSSRLVAKNYIESLGWRQLGGGCYMKGINTVTIEGSSFDGYYFV